MALLTNDQVSAIDGAFFGLMTGRGLAPALSGLFSLGAIVNGSFPGGVSGLFQSSATGTQYGFSIPQSAGFSWAGRTVGTNRVGATGDMYFDGTNLNFLGGITIATANKSLSIGSEVFTESASGGGQLTLTTGGGGFFLSGSPFIMSNGQAIYLNAQETDSLVQNAGIHTITSNVASGSASAGVWNVNTSNTLSTAGDLLFLLKNNATSKLSVDYQGFLPTVGGAATAGIGVSTTRAITAPRTGKTAADPSFITVTSPNDGNKHTYLVSGMIKITVAGSASINLQVAFTDHAGAAQTLNVPLSLAASPINAATSVGFWAGLPIYITVNPNTTISVSTAGTFTSATYDDAAVIEQIN
jgi:hypothetical protein